MKQLRVGDIKNSLTLKESWVIFFILGIIMMNYPFLSIFNKNSYLAGFPLLFIYFYIGWLVSISVIYLFSHFMIHENGKKKNTPIQ